MSSNVKETARWRRRRRRRRIVPRGFFKLANVVLERRTRDGVVNFRVQFRRGELRGRTSTLGVAYNHRKQPFSNVRCALTCRSWQTFSTQTGFLTATKVTKVVVIGSSVSRTSWNKQVEKKKQEKRSDRFKWNGTRYNMLIFGREKSISKMEYIKLYKIYLTILV